MADKKPKPVAVPEEFAGLGREVSALTPTDKEAIIPIGIRLEQSWTTLRVAGAEKPLLELLKQSLKLLQSVYQETVADPAAACAAIGQAASYVEAAIQGDLDETLQAQCKQDLEDALTGNTKSAPTEESSKNSAAQGDLAAGLQAVEAISARLVSVDAEETETIQAIHNSLVALAKEQDIAGGAVGHLTLAAGQLETIIDGSTDAPSEALDNAAKAVGQAVEVQDNCLINAENEELPADTEAVEESASSAEDTKEKSVPEPQPEAKQEKTKANKPEPDAEQPAKAETKTELPVVEFPGEAVLSEDCDPELMKEFIVECTDHITNAEGSLLELESNPEDNDQINVVFRAFHTIKGTSGFLNLDRIQKCAHLAENLLDRAREGEIKILGGYADLALRSCDALRTMIEGLQGLSPGDKLPIPKDLNELLSILSDPEGAGFGEEEFGDETMRLGDILVGTGKASRRSVEKAEKGKGEHKIGEELVRSGAAKAQDVADAMRVQKQQKVAASAGGAQQVEASVRVSTGRLDSLINMVGELVIAQSMVAADPEVQSGANPRMQRNVTHAGKIIRELQDLTMSLRMVPLKGVFQKMNRLVRDLARKSNKKVKFVTEGEDTEIDRNMVESLNDPLVHMIRNSVDHGIESPDVREKAGKDPTGTVTLRAYHAAGNVIIELQDDGKGLDKSRIVAKATERGLMDPTRDRDMSDSDIFGLIFQAGFSTAEKVSDISGRGVGMDVVKRNIESLRGRIEVASKQGAGSTFSIRLPLTMAITDAMILRVGKETYLLPTVSIEQSFQPEHDTISRVSGRGEMVMLRGELLPLFRLHNLFDVPDAIQDPYEGLLVVIEGDGKQCALMVDELLGQQQVVIKSLGQGMAKVPGISGGAILGDGRVGLILDATGILQLAEGRAEAEPAMV
jgi:two-component system chemotaxis sensor kinase CheA